MKIEEAFKVKQEDTETQTKMVFIKEESEDMCNCSLSLLKKEPLQNILREGPTNPS